MRTSAVDAPAVPASQQREYRVGRQIDRQEAHGGTCANAPNHKVVYVVFAANAAASMASGFQTLDALGSARLVYA